MKQPGDQRYLVTARFDHFDRSQVWTLSGGESGRPAGASKTTFLMCLLQMSLMALMARFCMDRPRVASRKVMIWRSWSCASVSGLLMEPLSSWPSWISARARSHSRLGPEGHTGHLITNALAKPFSISSFRLADLGGKANSTIVLGASLSVHSPGECFRLPTS